MRLHMILLAGALCITMAETGFADSIPLQQMYSSEQIPGNTVWGQTGSGNTCTLYKDTNTKITCEVKYLTSRELQAYKLTWKGNAWVDSSGKPYDTDAARKAAGLTKAASYGDLNTKKLWGAYPGIWVMDAQNNLYVAVIQAPGKFHHSSFMAGGPIQAGGQIVIKNGIITAINNDSGHYKPTIAQFMSALDHLQHFSPDGVWCASTAPTQKCVHGEPPVTLQTIKNEVQENYTDYTVYSPINYTPGNDASPESVNKYLSNDELEYTPIIPVTNNTTKPKKKI